DHRAVFAQPGVAAQLRSDRDTTLPVRALFVGAGEQVTLVGPDRLIGERRLRHLAGHLLELGAGKDIEAVVLSLGAQKHGHPPLRRRRTGREAPLCSTGSHITPLLATVNVRSPSVFPRRATS